ncbi:imidazole glycerol phosphate synthase subunit HisH [Polaribacter aquimarinus]|uniref:Imidazole glycerol phosphate synthase subunit HisH n=1 Tax=Polaribacter aquimarinus TaxID=2100726 RepID=A0A2U2JAV8_9FLAO|nr:imidazole glycerol phosphate synthase subunit HisH [Polaribacter aquimarinus]PWG05477.1 imidazole glycerol phosphate synthase subunit HisH [Polaribacter aquimarinus]
MITIVDYGLGNLRSVQKSFERSNINVRISSDLKVIKNSQKLVLPGVGHFGKGMNNLKTTGILDVLNEKVLVQKTPILGICLGMQLMTKFSEESNSDGIGWIDAKTIRFEKDETKKFKVPHIGWNSVNIINNNNLLNKIENNSQYYFVHTYCVYCNNNDDIMTESEYGVKFHSSFRRENIFGVQFHPEKSFSVGIQMFKNFSNL